LGNLLPHYLNYQVFQFLLEAKASEHSARMVAMKNATDNAKQLIKDLTLEYNKLAPGEHYQRTSRNHQRRHGDGQLVISDEQRQNRSNHRSGRGRGVHRSNSPRSTTP
jgi:hypothetical protein